jgi:hypothetical protein
MIVVLDANALVMDPLCGGIAWRILALGAASWRVSVAVPRVAMIEAVAIYQRRVEEALAGLSPPRGPRRGWPQRAGSACGGNCASDRGFLQSHRGEPFLQGRGSVGHRSVHRGRGLGGPVRRAVYSVRGRTGGDLAAVS